MQLFAWYNIFFYVSLAIGILLLVGSAFGLLSVDGDFDHDVDHDIDGDIDHDLDHDLDGDIDGDIDHDLDHDADHDTNPLDVGRIPFSLLLMMGTLIFGTIGVISNLLLQSVLPAALFGWVSLTIAIVLAFLLTRRLARLILKIAPATETYTVSKASFRGCMGELTVATDTSFGAANLTDREGNLHTVTCKTIEGKLPRGTQVLVVDFLANESICIVEEVSDLTS